MQSAIPEATDLAAEPEHIQKLYGLDRDECRDTARNCLIARRLIERGVRMVQLWTGDGVSWDAHDDITGKRLQEPHRRGPPRRPPDRRPDPRPQAIAACSTRPS